MLSIVGLQGLGLTGLAGPIQFHHSALPQVNIASAVDQMAAGFVDALTQVHLPSATPTGSEATPRFCHEAGAFYAAYRDAYGASLHSCLCGAGDGGEEGVFWHYDTESGYPPAVGHESVELAIAVCGCAAEFAARYPAEKESTDLCRVAAACPEVDLVSMTTGDLSTAAALCDGDTCAAALADIFEEEAMQCDWVGSCRGLELRPTPSSGALELALDAASVEVICGPASPHASPPSCLDALIGTMGCDAACSDGLNALCPLLGECSSAELALGMASTTAGLCPADGSKVSRACAAAITASEGCDAECKARMAACTNGTDDGETDAAALGGQGGWRTRRPFSADLFAAAVEPTQAGLALGAVVGAVLVLISVFNRSFSRSLSDKAKTN